METVDMNLVDKVINKAGGQAALARMFASPVRAQSVQAWFCKGRIPINRLSEIERMGLINKEELLQELSAYKRKSPKHKKP